MEITVTKMEQEQNIKFFRFCVWGLQMIFIERISSIVWKISLLYRKK